MKLSTEATVSELLRAVPGAGRVFERYGIDLCRGGVGSLAEACVAVRAPIDEVLRALERGGDEPRAPHATLGLTSLIDHVLETHHAFERAELVRLLPLADRVAQAHGRRHPELREVAALVIELRADLAPHMRKEEQVLFPYLRQLALGQAPSASFGSVRNPIRAMLEEHDRVLELLHELSSVTAHYVPPVDGCNRCVALYQGLAELQADIQRHVHLENEQLFPLALRLDSTRAAAH